MNRVFGSVGGRGKRDREREREMKRKGLVQFVIYLIINFIY